MANLYSGIEKEMHVALLAGEKIGNLEKRLQNKYQVDSTAVRNVYHNLKGKHTSIKELKKTQIKEIKSSISSIKQSIKTQEKKYQAQLKKGHPTQKQRFIIHQKKRRLQIKKHKLEKLQNQSTSLCFGTRKLFKAQYHLEENGYANHQEWLEDWQEMRTSNFLMVGSKTYHSGNQLCRLDHEGNLTITAPPCLIKEYGSKITTQNIKFRYGQEFIDIALSPTQHKRGQQYRNGTEMPVTHRFVRKKGLWYIHTHVELPDIPWISHRKNGAIGIDLNVDNIAWAYCDSEGNLKDQGQINIDLHNKSSGQTTHILSVAIGQILEVATKFECPVVIEKLDFTKTSVKHRRSGR